MANRRKKLFKMGKVTKITENYLRYEKIINRHNKNGNESQSSVEARKNIQHMVQANFKDWRNIEYKKILKRINTSAKSSN